MLADVRYTVSRICLGFSTLSPYHRLIGYPMRQLRDNIWLTIILITAAIPRLIYAFSLEIERVYRGGDSRWYLINGKALFSGEVAGSIDGMAFDISVIPVAPLYLVFLGAIQQIFTEITTIVLSVRMIQIALSLLAIYLAYRIGCKLYNKSAGLITAGALALSPAFIFEPSLLLTESLYIFWMTAGIWIYVEFIVQPEDTPNLRWKPLIFTAILLGLATLTRAVLLLFPLGIAGHIIIASGWKLWRRALPYALGFLLAYAAVASTWTIYNLVYWDRLVIGSDQLMPVIWRGAVTDDGNPWQNDELLGESTPAEQAAEVISSDPAGYIQLRLRELAGSYARPHGVVDIPGRSLREVFSVWRQNDGSIGGLLKAIQGDYVWLKLIIYAFHYVGMLAGVVGMWLTRRQWRLSLVLIGYIIYTTLLHIVVLALPRYIFPTQVFFWIFAGVTLAKMWQFMQQRRKTEETSPIENTNQEKSVP